MCEVWGVSIVFYVFGFYLKYKNNYGLFFYKIVFNFSKSVIFIRIYLILFFVMIMEILLDIR